MLDARMTAVSKLPIGELLDPGCLMLDTCCSIYQIRAFL